MKKFVASVVALGALAVPLAGNHGQVLAAAKISPRSLALAAGAFAPATMAKGAVDPNSNNVNTKVWPRDEHSVPYTDFGRVNGYYQIAHQGGSKSKKSIAFEYDGSIFKTAAGAQGAWHDGSTYDLKFKNTKTFACPSGLGTNCTRLTATFTDGNREIYDVVQVGSCIAEARAKSLNSVVLKKQGAIFTTLAHIDRAAFAAMSANCK